MMTRYNITLPSISSEETAKKEITTSAGFICNKDSHWFAIRKINNRFWNLNSTLEKPELISSFHLALEIESFINSGYSVFIVVDDHLLPKSCTSEHDRLRGQAKFWWKEDDLLKGKANPRNEGSNPWKNLGSGVRLDGKATKRSASDAGMGINMTEEEMIQRAISASIEQTKPPSTVKLEPEPPASNTEAVRIQFRLPTGKKVVRRFLKTDLVEMTYKFVEESCVGEGHGRVLELKSGFPPKSIEDKKTSTISDAGLAGEMIQGRFV